MRSALASDLLDLVELVGGHGRSKGVALVFVCYLDGSDADGGDIVTLAGYVAPLETWREFETQVEPVFKDFGVDVLHAIEFHGTRGCFEGWKWEKKRAFIEAVYGLLPSDITFGISQSARKGRYKERQGMDRRRFGSMSAYGLTFSTTMWIIANSTTLSERVRAEGLSFVVESGHNNNAEIEQFFHRLKGHPEHRGAMRAITFADKSSSRAIQLADLCAFYSRRHCHRLNEQAPDQMSGELTDPGEWAFAIMNARIIHFMDLLADPVSA